MLIIIIINFILQRFLVYFETLVYLYFLLGFVKNLISITIGNIFLQIIIQFISSFLHFFK